jgi:hypothetical protein
MVVLEDFFVLITDELFEKVRVGADVEPTAIIDGQDVMMAAIHCCINGPVGIGKLTNFPGIEGEVKIRDLFSSRISNKAWRKLCNSVAEHLERNLNEAQKASTQSYVLHGGFWPHYDTLM